MLIITSLAAAALAVSPGAADAPTSAPPPMIVTVSTAVDVTPSLVSRVLEEADALWHAAGLTFEWRRVGLRDSTRLDRSVGGALHGLRIMIGMSRGVSHDGQLPLGWIEFEQGTPGQEIYLSYQNALDFLADSPGVAGPANRMPPVEREIKVARAMGRALAHELGHYLLASKIHTRRGLMQASHTAMEFFDYSRRGFELDLAQRQMLAARLSRDAVVVRQ